RDDQHRHAVGLRAGQPGGGGAAAHAAGPEARLPGAVLAGAADRLRAAVLLPDAQPDHADLGPLRGLAGGGRGDLVRLRASACARGPPGRGRERWSVAEVAILTPDPAVGEYALLWPVVLARDPARGAGFISALRACV